MSTPAVSIFALGGTIAMTATSGGGVAPTLTGDQLVEAVPDLASVANLKVHSFRQMPGAHLTFDDLEALASAIEKEVAGGARGIVITQGTDTIEETAFTIDRLLSVDVPVVVTGAMRNPAAPGADGPANLLAATHVAVADQARGLGVVVVLGDQIHAARFCKKMHTGSPAAFASPLSGPIGWVSEGSVHIVVRPDRGEAIQRIASPSAAPVALITLSLGDDGRLLDAVPGLGFKGVVVDAMGAGHTSPAVADRIERLLLPSMPVILSSRIGAGPVFRRTYGFVGSEIDLLRRGMISAGWLDGLKARILLELSLRHGSDRGSIAAAFAGWEAA